MAIRLECWNLAKLCREHRGNCGTAEGAPEDANEGDADLNGGQEIPRVAARSKAVGARALPLLVHCCKRALRAEMSAISAMARMPFPGPTRR